MNFIRKLPRCLFWCWWLGALPLGGYAQHFKPQHHLLGDVHPFFHDGECFLYYLKPGKYEAALARSPDYLHWKETPISHDPLTPDDWMSPYFVLGVFHDPDTKLFRSFYGHAQGRIVSSVSKDLLHWSCAPKEYHIPPAHYYQRRRDPFVFWIPEMKEYGCVMTTWMKGRPKETGGALSLATSPDLRQWKDHGPILDPGTIAEPECPQMFSLGGRWHLLASIYDRAVGKPAYWTSTSPLGPWRKEPDGLLDGKDLCAAQIAFDGAIPILFGWVPKDPAQPGRQTWGGLLALPREVHALPDGKLGTRLPVKINQAFERLPWQTQVTPGTQWIADLTLTLPEDKSEIRINLAPLGEISFTQDHIRVHDIAGDCWGDLPVTLPTAAHLDIRILVDHHIVEVFAHDHYTLATRLPDTAGPVNLSLPQSTAHLKRFSGLLLDAK
jgi:sucrose-6-phosphate hydrolase SacC (GH32 family)